MELRQLRYFVNIVDTMSFTMASKQLYISQSTLSQQIIQLEDELAVKLFNRNGKHISLTEEGRYFYPYAKDCIQKTKDAITILEELKKNNTGEIRIGVTYAFRKVIANALIAFYKKYPNIKIIVHFGSSNEMLEKLSRDLVDILITFDFSLDSIQFDKQVLFETPICLVVPKTHMLSKRKDISLRELANEKLIVQSKNFHTWDFVHQSFRQQNLCPNFIMEVNDNPTLLELIKNDIGFGIMAQTAIEKEEYLIAIPIEGLDMKRKVSAIRLKNIYLSEKLQYLCNLIQQNFSDTH
ncbi:LysR family transcriptional regulator [Rhizosphaericola mali]|uniref:LysR family transcriptional regulator n=1 Tax=Rhizosphaericola mali TaxID=2545455 RepID=A0A5P2G0F7_9BACT|nr:LysR family transcriptional regulator [Rhizosphaericola mali]QES88128.1 LysR family transcriptional regulator [Rhizosphaericola mali]